MIVIFKPYNLILNEKILCFNILKSSRGKL